MVGTDEIVSIVHWITRMTTKPVALDQILQKTHFLLKKGTKSNICQLSNDRCDLARRQRFVDFHKRYIKKKPSVPTEKTVAKHIIKTTINSRSTFFNVHETNIFFQHL